MKNQLKKIHLLALTLTGFCLVLAGESSIAAENSIKQIQVGQEGDQVLLKVQMAAPLKSLPGNWSVVEPPRVVFDFPETDNQSGQSSQKILTGDLKSLNLVQTDKLTRLVLNLYRPTKFSSEIVGDVLFIRLQTHTIASSQEPAPSVYQPAAPKAMAIAADTPATVRDIAFRRSPEGDAVITVDLTDGSVPVDIRRAGDGVTVELRNVELPERLQSRRDVNDFATPVTTITSRAMGDLTRLNITARGRWFHQASVANNRLTIEIKPIPADEANKLVQTGQEGQKVSINFFDADAAMVLRTLAEISGKNVLIDPSLNGRRITVNLDNLPYDQALEIVMTQVNAAMRVRNDVIVFGDRAALQKRDQDMADELARANDTAPLVAETFKLNYVKAADVVSLVNSGFSQAAPTTATAPPAAADGATPSAGSGSSGNKKGMLSPRGNITSHPATNQIFVSDIASVVEAIREVIRNIDIPPKQVMIEARIVEASTGFANSLGVRLKYFASGVASLGGGIKGSLGSTTGNLSNVDAFGAPATPSLIRTSTQGFGANYDLSGSTAVNLMLFNSAATRLLSFELLAAESDSKNKTISAPRVVTQNRKKATIENMQELTFTTGINLQTGQPITEKVSAPLTLEVTPSITPDNKINMELKIAKSTITRPNVTSVNLDKNTLDTNVIVENGGTVVIGGFSREGDINTEERVPFLGDLPYVGFLFKVKAREQSRSELLVFITPRIVTDTVAQR